MKTELPVPHIFTTEQLAARWSMSPGHLANMRNRKGPVKNRGPRWLKIGRSVRYRLVDVLAYEAKR